MIIFGIYAPDGEECLSLCRLLELWASNVCVKMELALWHSSEEAQADPRAGECSLIFFGEGEIKGRQLDIARELCRCCPQGKAMFLSSDPLFAIECYCLHPAGVLEIPMRYRQLARTMERCFPFWREGLSWIEVPVCRSSVRIPLCELEYAEASGRHCILHCSDGCIQVGCSLGEIERMLPQRPFLRCQRSYIVNLCSVDRLEAGGLVMRDDCVISVGRGRYKEIQDCCAEFFRLTRN